MNKVRLYRQLLSWGLIREGDKRFRADIGMWEQEKYFLGASFYIYSKWVNGEVIVKRQVTKIKGAKYVTCKTLNPITIGESEMKERYGNKFLVPTNINYNPLYE